MLLSTMFIGLFFIVSIILLCNYYKEKKDTQRTDKDKYIIPTYYRLLSNKPFLRLVIPWIIDVTLAQIFATMLPFYISMIINPYEYCVANNIDTSSVQCSANNWLGISIFSFFLACIATTMIWHIIINKLGKKKAWQLCSLIAMVTFSLFLLCGQGSLSLLVAFSIITSIPAGGLYLNEVFISDIIEYDEFLTGCRNEGIYMVFSSFIPKMVGILAQSVPLAIMSCILILII